MELRERYIDLTKQAVCHSLYPEVATAVPRPRNPVKRWFYDALRNRGLSLMRLEPYDETTHGEGRQWPPPEFARTMIGRKRLDNIHACVEEVLANQVPGDLIEAGVWRGGAAILMRAILAAHDVRDRSVWLADSFAGLPPPNSARYPRDIGATFHEYDVLACSLPDVEEGLRRFGLLDSQVRFLPGWFKDTLPGIRDREWSLIRIDADMYESTLDALTNLYPGLSPGGFIIVDDYVHPACMEAVDDFRRDHAIEEPIEQIDWTAVFWRRGDPVSAERRSG